MSNDVIDKRKAELFKKYPWGLGGYSIATWLNDDGSYTIEVSEQGGGKVVHTERLERNEKRTN